ncbi:MAG: hypothetical protein JO336_17975 [Acidobacteriia bacterium]|nr:hypothetical protein [Terriglobia bacterium]MBV8906476.1 hypothetical protein [Terriglobia bacterium]MBV9743798.1 hypothetical protein [Terriglobia bacterium]
MAPDIVTPDIKAELSEARTQVMRAIEQLMAPAPASLDECAAILQNAVELISVSCSGLREDPVLTPDRRSAAQEEARELGRAVRQARILLDAALEFHLQWDRRLGALSGGYTPDGNPAAVGHGFRVVVLG